MGKHYDSYSIATTTSRISGTSSLSVASITNKHGATPNPKSIPKCIGYS